MLRLIAIPLILLTCLFDSSAWQQACADQLDWSGWLGPQRDGWVSGFQPPTVWPKKLEKSWQVEVGSGYGSPLVSGDRVYQHARQGEQEVVWCLDLKTGAVIWRKSYPAPFQMGGGGEKHGKGPKASPTLVDGKIFTLSITGVLSAWDATSGELLWRRDYSSRFEKTHPYWGVATSPLVDGNHVIVHFGNDEDGQLVALDATSGKEIWTQGQDGASYSSQLVVEIDGVRQIVEWNHRALLGVESATGRLLWEYEFPHEGHNQNMPTPVFHRGHILLGGENRGLLSLRPTRDGDQWTVKEAWYQEGVALDMSSAVINGDLLFGFSHYGSGRFFCLDTKTGQIKWQGPGRTGDNVMFLSVPGYVVALINDGQLQVIAAKDDQLDTVASYQVSQTSTWAPPVLWQDSILIKDDQTLTKWRLSPKE